MEENFEVRLTVIMADNYFFMPGDEVHISKREGFYYVSRNHLEFGLAKEVSGQSIRNEGDLRSEFDAVVTKVDSDCQQLEVRAELGRRAGSAKGRS